MVSLLMLVVLVLCAGGIAWELRRRGHVYTKPVSPAAPRETLALQAFTHGNSCLAAGQFADAIAAFHRAREIDPKHPHVAGRLAEVERRQHAVSVTPLGNATVWTRRP
jgi:Tetratricopeptide repeat